MLKKPDCRQPGDGKAKALWLSVPPLRIVRLSGLFFMVCRVSSSVKRKVTEIKQRFWGNELLSLSHGILHSPKEIRILDLHPLTVKENCYPYLHPGIVTVTFLGTPRIPDPVRHSLKLE
jgi:hypothetical protein